MDHQPKVIYELRSAAKLKYLQTVHAALNLDDRISPVENPSQEVLNAINLDIATLKPYGDTVLTDNMQPLTQVAISTKKAFGKFSDTALASLASKQLDLTTKADAFAVLENPTAHTHLIDDLYNQLQAQDKANQMVDLKAAAHATAGLYGHVNANPALFGRAQQFCDIVYEQSFIQSTPHHITNLALFSNKNFLPAAIELIDKTKSAYHANLIILDDTGVTADLGESAKQKSVDRLVSVVVDAGNIAELVTLAGNTSPNINVNSDAIDKLFEQAKSMRSDKRLAIYLSSAKKIMSPTTVHSLQKRLNTSFEEMNTVASQTALLEHAKLVQEVNPSVSYSTDLMESSILNTKAYFKQLEEHNKDKTLIDLAQPKVEFTSNIDSNDKEVVPLAGIDNEETLKDQLVKATKIIMARCESYNTSISFNPGTSELIKNIISQQIFSSVEGKVNDLNRVLTQPVSKVVDMLDSRNEVQDRIKFDADTQNRDNTAVASRESRAGNYNEYAKNSVFELEPTLTITSRENDGYSETYNLMSYESFDDMAKDIYRKHDNFQSENYNVTLGVEEAQPYLTSALSDDLKDFMSEPSTMTMYRLNQHWQLSTSQFVDVRENDDRLKSSVKTNLEVKENRQPVSIAITNTPQPPTPASIKRITP